jgi:hypothetical protein
MVGMAEQKKESKKSKRKSQRKRKAMTRLKIAQKKRVEIFSKGIIGTGGTGTTRAIWVECDSV